MEPYPVKLIAIQPGSPPWCTVDINGVQYEGIRMVMGPNGWKPLLVDILDIL